MSAPRVMVYVQHLLGTGHLKRAVLLADAMVRRGLAVTLVSGGMPVPGLVPAAARWVQLPPVAAADLGFKALVDAQGRAVDDTLRATRRQTLLDVWRETDPQLLLIELFPFGRRQMRFELLPLLDAARQSPHPPLIVSSVRDVLGGGQGDPQRQQRMLALFDQYFDHVLVHGDPALVPFERSFAHVPELGERMHYTGYVVDPVPIDDDNGIGDGDGRDEVLVSAGGGAVGMPLLETAIRARTLSQWAHCRWRVLVGAGIGAQPFSDLVALARALHGDAMVVERNRTDFPQLLRRCRVSISQAGYNTVMETLQAGARSVMVPFAGGSESEQTLRAELLAQRGWIVLVREADLTPTVLAHAVDQAGARAARGAAVLGFDGADNSAEWVWQRLTPTQSCAPPTLASTGHCGLREDTRERPGAPA
ncbi:MAG: glycosyltransferase [Burkholderiaceae bacterium]